MPALLLASVVATAVMMAMVVGMPLALYEGQADIGAPLEWLETLGIAFTAFAVSGRVVLEPVTGWSRSHEVPRPALRLGLAAILWAVLAALMFTAVLTVLGTWQAAHWMAKPFWPVFWQTITAFEWAILAGVLFIPLTFCCLLGGMSYAWSRTRMRHR